MFERVQQSKDEAFKVYLEGLQKEKEYAELLDQIAKNEKARKKQLQMAIISAVASSVLSVAGQKLKSKFAANAAKVGAAGVAEVPNAAAAKANATTAKISVPGPANRNLTNYFSQASSLSNKLSQTQSTTLSKNFTFLSGFDLSSIARSARPRKGLGSSWTNPLLPSSNWIGQPLPGQQRASGGLISGGSNIRDDVPAMLTGGEFVLNNRATQRIGVQNLNQLNNGQSVGGEGASSEMTQALISKLDELIQATQNSSSENVVVNVSSNETVDQNQQNTMGAEKELHKKIRQAVLDVIAQEKRLGGSLEKSR
jgi:hypothetical protein